MDIEVWTLRRGHDSWREIQPVHMKDIWCGSTPSSLIVLQPVTSYPLAAVVVALEDFFGGFGPSGQPSLSTDGLVWLNKVWRKGMWRGCLPGPCGPVQEREG